MHCGVGVYTALLAKSLAMQRGVSVRVLTSIRGDVRANDLDVMFTIRGWDLKNLFPIIRDAMRWSPDIVHVQYPTQAYGENIAPWLLPLAFKCCGFSVVQTWHELMPPQRWLRLLIALAAKHVVVVRHNFEVSLPAWFRALLSSNHVRFIPNAAQSPSVSQTEVEMHALRGRYLRDGKKLVVYFGFMYPHKGVERLFEIADPQSHHLVLAGHIDEADPYHRQLRELSAETRWRDSVTLAGYLPDDELARLIMSADAAVFPFRKGAEPWNSTVASATALGTFVIVTSTSKLGYDAENNIFYSAPDNLVAMRSALQEFSGRKIRYPIDCVASAWESIATAYIDVYRQITGG